MSAKFNVLVVDDDMINRKLLKSMLSKSDKISQITEAANGAEAMEIAQQGTINLILLDIVMPIMNGIEMLRVARSNQSTNDIPIIVLTTDETKKNEALELGANGFLMKPVRSNDLLHLIESLEQI